MLLDPDLRLVREAWNAVERRSQHFTDPDDYAAAIRATTAELTVIGRGHFTAKLTRIDLHRLWMQRFSREPAADFALWPR